MVLTLLIPLTECPAALEDITVTISRASEPLVAVDTLPSFLPRLLTSIAEPAGDQQVLAVLQGHPPRRRSRRRRTSPPAGRRVESQACKHRRRHFDDVPTHSGV